MQQKRVQILVATYNGGEFILPQLNSILGQTHKNLFVTVRDDGSIDNTTEVLKNIVQHNSNVELFENTGIDKGHCCNFSSLCEIALQGRADYFCFSDQDDVWYSEKISFSSDRILMLEEKYGKDTPILNHSDLKVVDECLNEIHPSFIKYQGLPNPDKHHFSEFLYQNVVTGCTTMFNRALLEFATPIPSCAVVHDFWFALCAEYIGKIGFVDQPLVDYRQHGNNSIGAISFENQTSYINRHIYKSILKFPLHIAQCIEQAKVLKQRCINREISPSDDKRKYLEQFITLKDRNLVERLKYVSIIFRGKRRILEKIYLYAVVAILPFVKVSK